MTAAEPSHITMALMKERQAQSEWQMEMYMWYGYVLNNSVVMSAQYISLLTFQHVWQGGGGGAYLWGNAEFIDFSQLCQLPYYQQSLRLHIQRQCAIYNPLSLSLQTNGCKVNKNLTWHSEHTVLMLMLWSHSMPGSKDGLHIVQHEAANGFHWINITHPYFLSVLFLGSSSWRWWMPVESWAQANLCTADYIKAENIAELTCCPGLRKADLLRRKNRVNVFHRYID